MKPSSHSLSDSLYLGSAARDFLSGHLAHPGYSGLFVLTDSNTKRECLPRLLNELPDFPLQLITMEAGEDHKNIDSCLQVWKALEEMGADRHGLLLNLGGGVVTDLGGFAASTFKRGMEFIHVPTTLLAMVDAAIGGKTGIDLGPVKNQIGVFRHPSAVCILPEFLTTLNERELVNGTAEMLKHGLIASGEHWSAVRNSKGIPSLALIEQSARIKVHIVEKDPEEKGERKFLNFGHTLGHAIESHFLDTQPERPWLHGEAIACGMILESYLSYRLLGLTWPILEEISGALLTRFPRIPIGSDDIEGILYYLKHDKKNSHGRIRFVLLKDLASPQRDIEVPIDVMQACFAYYNDL